MKKSDNLKIALISNMNNNYFGLLRYFIDLNIEVKLFCFIDEYKNFYPESDTWYIDKYKHHIDQVPFTYYNHYNTINGYDYIDVKEKLSSYNILIGSGPTPAFLSKIGRSLDYFFPYKTGIEYFKDDISFRYLLLSYKIRKFNYLQRKSLKKVSYSLNEDFRNLTSNRLASLKIKNIPLTIPMVYNEKIPNEVKLDKVYLNAIEQMKKSDYVVFHSGRHQWKRSTRDIIIKAIKNIPFLNNNANDSVIKSFHNFNKKNIQSNNLLVLFEYGTQVNLSKILIKELGIENYVIWIPTSPRKIILELHKYVNLSIGDIAVGGWGGKAIESLSCGVPIIQSVSKENFRLYKVKVNSEFPPFIFIDHEKDLVIQLEKLLEYYLLHPNKLIELGNLSKEWYDKYEGVEKAKKLLEIITTNYNKVINA